MTGYCSAAEVLPVLWGRQSCLQPPFQTALLDMRESSIPAAPAESRRLEFLHFGTDFLTVPPRIDQAEAHALYQGMASAVPLEAVNSGL